MEKNVLVVAPHADDETIGCGGTIKKLKDLGHKIHWLLVTEMSVEAGYSAAECSQRHQEIKEIINKFQFDSVSYLKLMPSKLDSYPLSDIILKVKQVFDKVMPSDVFVTYRNDAHSDHQVVYDSVLAACKTFRSPYVKSIYAYETLSETEFGLKPEDPGFKPNTFVNISNELEFKLNTSLVYSSQFGDFPFPRSAEAIKLLSKYRGMQSGCGCAEAFLLIKQINKFN